VIGTLVAATLFTPLKYRWVYLQTNFFRPEAVDSAVALVHRASKAGYNGIVYCDSKLQSLKEFPDFYLKGMNRFLEAARTDHIEIIPGLLPVGYADGMLHLDPSLIESLPCRKVAFTAHAGKLVQDQTELYLNGSFHVFKGNSISGLDYQDAPGKATFIDEQVEHGGNPSLRIDEPKSATDSNGNCRIVKSIALAPFHQYRLSFWTKTQAFERASDFRAIALKADGNTVSFQDAGVQPNEDWTQHSVVFDSLDNSSLKVYIGVWGGTTGKLWLSSVSLLDAGLLNVDRRPLCPVVFRTSTGKVLTEGKDFSQVVDPQFGNVPYAGEFDFAHPSPQVTLPEGSEIKEGDVVTADYYAATATDSGKTSVCLADPKTAALEKAEVERVDALFHASGYFLGQDEMRVQGWCGACEKSGKSVSQILADDIRRSVGYLKGKQAYVWSDMFDPHHNAVPNYYLVNGSLTGTWKGLPAGTIIVNWNSGHAKESLSFFHDLGLKQILAGYYDAPVENIKPWLEEAKLVGGASGVMYTTWVGNYNDLETFAKAAWGGG
jgi:hypothetical protein